MKIYDEAIPEVAIAAAQYTTKGQRVWHVKKGWHGTVTGEQLDNGTTFVEFDNIGKCGADPRFLAPLHADPERIMQIAGGK